VAEQAGLAGSARTGNVIPPASGPSWFLIGHLLHQPWSYAVLRLNPSAAAAALASMPAPPRAIAEPFVVDAAACIAFHTIEETGDARLPAEDQLAAMALGWPVATSVDVCPGTTSL